MSTPCTSLRRQIRDRLLESNSSSFWQDPELDDLLFHGMKDLWRAILDLHQDHFQTIDETNVSLTASATSLTGVPADLYRVLLIEPRDTTSNGAGRGVKFRPKSYQSEEFVSARTRDAQDPGGSPILYYAATQAGAPIAAPTIKVGPPLSSVLLLRLVYIPTLAALTSESTNPIPGESDNALINYTIAYALAKDREDGTPDPTWLGLYATEKQNLLVSLTPRQEQEPQVVDDFLFTDIL